MLVFRAWQARVRIDHGPRGGRHCQGHREAGPEPVRDFTVEPTADSEGPDALDVTIIIKDDALSGADAAVVLTDIQMALTASGDERFPIVQFATEDELARDGGPRP